MFSQVHQSEQHTKKSLPCVISRTSACRRSAALCRSEFPPLCLSGVKENQLTAPGVCLMTAISQVCLKKEFLCESVIFLWRACPLSLSAVSDGCWLLCCTGSKLQGEFFSFLLSSPTHIGALLYRRVTNSREIPTYRVSEQDAGAKRATKTASQLLCIGSWEYCL